MKLLPKHWMLIAFILASCVIFAHAKLAYSSNVSAAIGGFGAEIASTAWA